MGQPMAANLLAAGFDLTVWNRTASKTDALVARGARRTSAPAEAVAGSKIVIMMLENGAVVSEVLFVQGVADSCAPDTLIIDMSSIHPAIAKDHARSLREKGLRPIDAPVSGGTRSAATGDLAIMAGGAAEDVAAATPLFSALGRVTHVGPDGSGQLCKLVNQTIVAVTIGAVAEGLLLAEAGGADPGKVREAIATGFCQSRILEEHGRRMVERDFVAGGAVKNQLKDLDAVLDVARSLNLRLPLTERVRDLYADLAFAEKTELDHSALFLQLKALQSG
jgi:2-hydroxy-3-oxopropionate reductase